MNRPASASAEPPLASVRVWDLPTRLFHWLLACSVIGSIVSANIGGNAMEWHFRFGYVACALVAFRLLWGLVGGRWSRFIAFAYAPSTVWRYLRGGARPGEHLDVGHNPLGSLSVFALLGFLALQVATGLVADDEIASIGPLNRFVSGSVASQATGWHKDYGSTILIALAVLHVAAIVYYRVRKRQDLVGPMVHGDKSLPADVPASRDDALTRIAGLLLLAACAGATGWLVSLGG